MKPPSVTKTPKTFMAEAFDNWKSSLGQMETSVSDGVGKLFNETVDFAKKNEAGLIAAGLVVVGTVALVKSGAAESLLDLLQPAGGAAEDALERGAGDALSSKVTGALAPRAGTDLVGLTQIGNKAEFLKGVDTYVFDLDRTLVPSGDAYAAHTQELTRQLVQHTGLSEDFVSRAIDSTTKEVNSHLIEDRLDLIKPIQDLYPGVNLNERFPEIAPAVKNAYTSALKPSSDVVDLLKSLKANGKQLHVFTASGPATAAEKLEASGLSKYFDTVFTGAQHPIEDSRSIIAGASTRSKIVELMESPKADDAGYRQIINYLKTSPEKVMMTGDTNALDIAPAQQAGMHTAQANWMHQDGTHLAIPDLVLDSPADLQRLLQVSTS